MVLLLCHMKNSGSLSIHVIFLQCLVFNVIQQVTHSKQLQLVLSPYQTFDNFCSAVYFSSCFFCSAEGRALPKLHRLTADSKQRSEACRSWKRKTKINDSAPSFPAVFHCWLLLNSFLRCGTLKIFFKIYAFKLRLDSSFHSHQGRNWEKCVSVRLHLLNPYMHYSL